MSRHIEVQRRRGCLHNYWTWANPTWTIWELKAQLQQGGAVRISLICWTGAPQGLLELLLCCAPSGTQHSSRESHEPAPVCSSSELVRETPVCSVQMWAGGSCEVPAVGRWQQGVGCRCRTPEWGLGCSQPTPLLMWLLCRFCCVAVLEFSQLLAIQNDLDKRISVWMLELLFEALGWLSSGSALSPLPEQSCVSAWGHWWYILLRAKTYSACLKEALTINLLREFIMKTQRY